MIETDIDVNRNNEHATNDMNDRASRNSFLPEQDKQETALDLHDAMKRYGRLVYKHVLYVTRDPMASDDIVQEVFLKLWQHSCNKEISNPEAWLYTVARNAALNYLAQRHTRTFKMNEDNLLEKCLAPDVAKAVGERVDLKQALEQLPDRERSCLLLYTICGYSQHEIGDTLNIRESSVSVFISRARRHLRNIL